MEQHGLGAKGVGTAHDDTSCDGQRTVKPCRHYGAAIDLGVELHQRAFCKHLGVGLDAERGRVAVGADHVEAGVGNGLAAYAEGIYRRVVLGHEKAVASLQCAERHGWVQTAEATVGKHVGDVSYCQEVYWRCVEKI